MSLLVIMLGMLNLLVESHGGDFAHVFTLCNGKVIRFHECMDTAAAAAAHRRDDYDEVDAL